MQQVIRIRATKPTVGRAGDCGRLAAVVARGEAMNLSLQDLCDRATDAGSVVWKSTVHRWLAGQSSPGLGSYARVCAALEAVVAAEAARLREVLA